MLSPHRVFTLKLPSITMGVGARRDIPNLVRSYGDRVFVVTDKGVASQPSFHELLVDLRASGCVVDVYDEVTPDPPVDTIYNCVERVDQATSQVVLGVGGGSALDVAKVAAVVANGQCELTSLFSNDHEPGRGLPTVLLPTTAGTGSEVTPIAVLSDTANQLKRGVVGDYLIADHAVIDPEMCVSLPPGPTAYTGMDTLTHAIEAYTNKFAVPLIDALALEVIRRVGASLERAVAAPEDLEARYDMSLASLLGGICLKPVNTAAVHALAYPLGGRFHVPHGVANSLLLPHVVRFNSPVVGDRYRVVAECLDSDDVIAAVRRLSAAVGTDKRMRDYGVEEEHLPEMAASAMEVQRLLKNNPREVTEADALEIYRQAW